MLKLLNPAFSRVLILILVVWMLPVWAGDSLTLIYSGNLDGELEPCGCSAEGNLGGIKRRFTLLSQLRKENPDLVVVSAGGLLSGEGPGDQLKGEYILKGFASLRYDAIGVQWRDLTFGPELILQETLPWVASNWHELGESTVMAKKRVIQRAGQKIAFFSWLNPEESPLRSMQGEHKLADESPLNMRTALNKAKRNGELTVLATTLTMKQVAVLVNMSDVDVLIERAAYEKYGAPRMEGHTLIVQPGSRGMRLGRLDLEIKNNRIEKWQHKELPMPVTIADAPELEGWYEEYNNKVKAEYLQRVELRKLQQSGNSPFVGEEMCSACHGSQHKTWSVSQHAKAYEDLEEVGKAYDPSCIKCHTVGFDQPGGFFDINLTSHLMGVQCESCHGAGRDHVESAGKKPVANAKWHREEMCAQCHTQPHSPGFNIETYWPKIAH